MMKPILRNLRNGFYFEGGASWTPDPADALVYADVESAREAPSISGIGRLELNLLLFDDPRYTVRLRLETLFSEPLEFAAGRFQSEQIARRGNDCTAVVRPPAEPPP